MALMLIANRLPAVRNRGCHALSQVARGQADSEVQPHAQAQTRGRSSCFSAG